MAAPAAPVGVAGAEGLAAIATATGWVVLAALLWLYRRSLKKVLLGFASLIDVKIPLRGLPDIHPFRSVSKWIVHQADRIDALIGAGQLACEHATVYLLQQAWNTVVWTAREIGDLAVTVEHALGLQRLGDTPALVKTLLAPLTKALAVLRKSVAAAERQADALYGRARRGIDHLSDVATKTLPKELARVTSRVGHVEKTLSGLRGHAGRIEALLGATAVATLVAAALSRLGLRWLRCGNVKKTGKAVCGMDGDLLSDLLLGVATLTVGLNIVTFAEEMGEVVEEVAADIHRLVT